MKKMFAKSLLVMALFFLLGALSCSQGGVPQADYDAIKNKLAQAESQLKALQDKAPATITVTAPVGTQPADLTKTIDELKKQIEAYAGQIKTLDSLKTTAENGLKDLNAKYAELQKQIQALTAPPAPFTEEAVEQAIFGLINQERTRAGAPELAWGRNLYNITRQHGKYMYDNSRYEPSSWPFFQEIYWGAGYTSADKLANGALLVWKNFEYRYEHGILSRAFKYGAVGAYKVGEVFYITFMGADVP